jgi:hypothetical protein
VARSGATWTKGHGPPHKFKPGQSGNPNGGSKKSRTLVELARAHTAEAIAALVADLAVPERRCAAACALLDRAWGKPPVAILAHINGEMIVGGIDGPPRETMEQWLARRQRELDILTAPAPPIIDQDDANGAPPPSNGPKLPQR